MRLEDMQIRIDIADRPWCFALLWIARTGEQFCAAVSDAEVLRLHIGIDADICRGDEGCVIGTSCEQDDSGQRASARRCVIAFLPPKCVALPIEPWPDCRARERYRARRRWFPG